MSNTLQHSTRNTNGHTVRISVTLSTSDIATLNRICDGRSKSVVISRLIRNAGRERILPENKTPVLTGFDNPIADTNAGAEVDFNEPEGEPI